MTIINTNIQSLVSQQSLVTNGRRLSRSMAELSTGHRINSAADDAAGMAIGSKLRAQVMSLNQAVRNVADGASLMQTADGAAEGVTQMLFRMRELALQALNGTNSSSDQTSLNTEYIQLRTQVKDITANTQWNGMKIIGGDKATVVFQVGANATDNVAVLFKNMWVSGVASGVSGTNLLSTGGMNTALSGIDRAMLAVDDFRSSLGAAINRLSYAADNSVNMMTKTAASRSRIMDTDYAKATSELARAQIIQQAGTAMLSQANQSPRLVAMMLR